MRFKEQVHKWREMAILNAVAELLQKEDCRDLTMDQVARCVGVAKGSLYLNTTSCNGPLEQLLERWAAQAPAPQEAL